MRLFGGGGSTPPSLATGGGNSANSPGGGGSGQGTSPLIRSRLDRLLVEVGAREAGAPSGSLLADARLLAKAVGIPFSTVQAIVEEAEVSIYGASQAPFAGSISGYSTCDTPSSASSASGRRLGGGKLVSAGTTSLPDTTDGISNSTPIVPERSGSRDLSIRAVCRCLSGWNSQPCSDEPTEQAAGSNSAEELAQLQDIIEKVFANSVMALAREALGDDVHAHYYKSQPDNVGIKRAAAFANNPMQHEGPDPDHASSSLFGATCRKGIRGNLPNQDCCSVLVVEQKFTLYVVCDGHGKYGHQIADFVADLIPKMVIEQHEQCSGDMVAVLKDVFRKAQLVIKLSTKLKKLKALASGCSCTAVVHHHHQDRLTIAYVGNSDACIGQRDLHLSTVDLEAKPLTLKHTPASSEERVRIAKAGGHVMRDTEDNYWTYTGQEGRDFIKVSRSLGDLLGHRDAGISCEPTVAERALTLDDQVLLLCTDGVWEFVTPKDAMGIVSCHFPEDATKVANEVALHAWNKWIKEEGGDHVDNITVLVAFLYRRTTL